MLQHIEQQDFQDGILELLVLEKFFSRYACEGEEIAFKRIPKPDLSGKPGQSNMACDTSSNIVDMYCLATELRWVCLSL